MYLYKQLHTKISYLTADQIDQIKQAYLMASVAHVEQQRDNGEAYIIHPVAVACILAQMHIDYQSIIAALLHDTIEDTLVDKKEISARFGQTVADLVDGVTKLTKIESSNQAENHAQNFRKMILAMSRDIRVILIKLADRWHNMQTIQSAAKHKRARIAKETLDIYAPIANRLGMHEMYTSLENLAFAVLYPRRYRILQKAVEQAHNSHIEIMTAIETELKNVLTKHSIEHSAIAGRKKHLYGIYQKMQQHHNAFANIMDVHAFRIIVNTIDKCYRVLGIVHNLYKPIPGKFKDYIALPKVNGYQSLHSILFGPQGAPIEIQIRTKEMDQMANNGIAAHWLYKNGDVNINNADIRTQQWVNNLLEMQQNTSSSLEFIENVKIDLFPDEVYVFTPKGDIKELPRGSTAVDLAYTIHTDIGNTCTAVRIDRKFLPLSTVLSNGQMVSIITSATAGPNPNWLNFVTTGKARVNIRNYLKNKKCGELIALGKQLLNKAFNDLKIDFNNIHLEAISNFLKKINLKNIDELYESIGVGNHFAAFVAHQLANIADEQTEVVQSLENKPLLIHGADGLAITFCNYCCPIPGDPIVGYLNKGRGLDIHIQDCTHLTKLRKQSEHYLPVEWAQDVDGNFRAALKVDMHHKRGALAELTGAISEAHAVIDDIFIGERNGEYCSVGLQLLVKNLSHLQRIIRRIKKLPVTIETTRKKYNPKP